jgi:DNA polymerase I-like protein with 3'-5' exonuclease and polymerase domains
VKVTKSGYVEGNTNVRNYPIQYLATGEIIPIGVTYIWHHMKEEGLRSLLVNTVHDSIITEEYPEETARLDEITTDAFSNHVPAYLRSVYDFSFDIPLDIDSEQGTHWGEY